MSIITERQGLISFLGDLGQACWTKAEGGDMSMETTKVATGCLNEPKKIVQGAVDISELTIEKNLDLPLDNIYIAVAHQAMKNQILNKFQIIERKVNDQGLRVRFQLYRNCVIKSCVVAMYDAESSTPGKLTITLDVEDITP